MDEVHGELQMDTSAVTVLTEFYTADSTAGMVRI